MGKCSTTNGLMGAPVTGKPVTECQNLGEVFESALPAFGGAYLRRVYDAMKQVIEKRIPLVVTCAGPITVSDQHRAWLIPLIKAANTAYITVTDAICYHDGHDCLRKTDTRPIREVALFGDDAELREQGVIRVADTGFDEQILFDQDAVATEILQRPEFQKRMTTTERNYLLGKEFGVREKALGVAPGLLSTCADIELPVFIGAPADGSMFLNSVKLWALERLGKIKYGFDYDLHEDVFESCAYHHWGLFDSEPKSLAILILGGGVPKNYSLQPEPALSQIFFLDNIRGYDYDAQIVSSPVTDGSLSSCEPSEAVSWGKINPATYRTQTVSMQGDYSSYMPFVVRALVGKDLLHNPPQPLRLYGKRDALKEKLLSVIASDDGAMERMMATLSIPLELKI
ncbi:MAG TPA: deoxyhypusine synthase family protein [Terracidiphilus sp.]|nr:deoxyhypusine synthase family protein [Terracidiphilus sp.]